MEPGNIKLSTVSRLDIRYIEARTIPFAFFLCNLHLSNVTSPFEYMEIFSEVSEEVKIGSILVSSRALLIVSIQTFRVMVIEICRHILCAFPPPGAH